MPLNFPNIQDLPLTNSPLREVIFQVRFAPLLEIAEKLPTSFHSQIRNQFPNYEVNQPVVDRSPQLPSEYSFKSPSDKSRVSLGANFVSFSTQEYSHWNEFKSIIKISLNALTKSYKPIFVSRIGLRYINELNTKNTGLQAIEDILGIVNSDLTHSAFLDSWSLPKRAINQLLLEDGDNELNFTMAFEKEPLPVVLLDYDYFITFSTPQVTDNSEIISKVDGFHKNCYNTFRWSIKEDRINIFDPKEG